MGRRERNILDAIKRQQDAAQRRAAVRAAREDRRLDRQARILRRKGK